jgi:hypothetical protein
VPGAFDVPIDFACPLFHAAAWPVQKTLGAIGDRADSGGFIENTVPAKRAFLLVLTEASDIPEKK